MPAWLLALLLLQSAAPAADVAPTLPAERLVAPGTELSGAAWSVESPVPVRGYLGQFVLDTEWGPIEVQGRELLALRIGEIEALATLDEINSSEAFVDAFAGSAAATGRALGRVVTQPVETVRGIPAGLGRMIKRTAASARRIAVAVGDATQRPREEPDEEADPALDPRDFANELAGVNQARRDLARQLGIDPYTGNPLIQERLEKLAWAMVAGGLSMNLVMGELGGTASDVISTSRKLDSLAWDLPPSDLRRQLEQRLVERGTEPRAAREFLRNSSFTPTLQLAFVDALEALGRPQGEPAIVALAETVRGEVHARFLIQQLKMLAQKLPEDEDVAELIPFEASLAAIDDNGELWITMPVDYLSWDDSAGIVAAKDGDPVSHLVIAGGVTERARGRLEAAGWAVEAGVGLAE